MLILRTLGYKELYNDFDEVSIEGFIQEIPTKNVIEAFAWFNAQLHVDPTNQEVQLKFVNAIAGRFPEEDKKKIEKKVNDTINSGHVFVLVSPYAALLMMQKAILAHNDLQRIDNLSPEQELRMFKAFLLCNQEWIEKQEKGFGKIAINNADDLTKKLLPAQIPFQELNITKQFTTQSVKAIYFFKFCESNPLFSGYLKVFLGHYQLDTWHEYLFRVLELYTRELEPPNVPSILHVENKHQSVVDFLDQFTLSKADISESDDFLSLRQTPIYKLADEQYCFINLNFFVDKIYQGIRFEFGSILIQENAQYKGKPISSMKQFLGIYGSEFSEKGLFYKVMKHTFANSGYLLLTGEEMKSHLGEGEPDFYMRDRKKVYLIEYKDVTIGADVKHSHDFEEVKKGIFIKVVEDSKGKKEGVSQLVDQILKLRTGEFNSFDEYELSDAIVYPILVYTDFNLGLAGVNRMVNKEFRERLENAEVSNRQNIKDVTLVHLDDIIRFQDLVRDKKVKINHCLNEYIKKTKNRGNGRDKSHLEDQVISFDTFVHRLTFENGWATEPPQIFKDELYPLVEVGSKKNSH